MIAEDLLLLYEYVKVTPFGLIEVSAYMDGNGNIVKFKRRKSTFSKEFLTLMFSMLVNRICEVLRRGEYDC